MLIPYMDLKKKYKVYPKGILHVGAHLGEEAPQYAKAGVAKVVWIEANPELIPALSKALAKYPHDILNACVSNRVGEKVKFNVTNNGQSSSLLELHRHKKWVPDVWVDHTIEVETTTIDLLHEVHDFTHLNFLNMDLQGAELLALQGAEKYLETVQWIYTEVNKNYLYKNCVLIGELDEFLLERGFERRATEWTPHEWGDAFYMRKQ